MRYRIERKAWSDKTFNGYEDNPYWHITINNGEYGLTDGGKLWPFSNYEEITINTILNIKNIINECNLNIIIK